MYLCFEQKVIKQFYNFKNSLKERVIALFLFYAFSNDKILIKYGKLCLPLNKRLKSNINVILSQLIIPAKNPDDFLVGIFLPKYSTLLFLDLNVRKESLDFNIIFSLSFSAKRPCPPTRTAPAAVTPYRQRRRTLYSFPSPAKASARRSDPPQ